MAWRSSLVVPRRKDSFSLRRENLVINGKEDPLQRVSHLLASYITDIRLILIILGGALGGINK